MPQTHAIRDGTICTIIIIGDLDLYEMRNFLYQAAIAIDDRTERLVLDLAEVTFLDCAGLRALAIAASFMPAGRPVLLRSLSLPARRLFALIGLDPADFRHPDLGPARVAAQADQAPAPIVPRP